MKIEFSGQIFEKYSNIKFHENPSNGSRVVQCGQTDGQTGIMKLIVAFRNFANAPKNKHKATKEQHFMMMMMMMVMVTIIIIMLIARGSRDLVEKQ
jgi:hypothetical protein